jgi:hypothetical protein
MILCYIDLLLLVFSLLYYNKKDLIKYIKPIKIKSITLSLAKFYKKY